MNVFRVSCVSTDSVVSIFSSVLRVLWIFNSPTEKVGLDLSYFTCVKCFNGFHSFERFVFGEYEEFGDFRGFLTPLPLKLVSMQMISGALNVPRVSSVLRVSGVSWV